jgi:hypothetical protein
MASTVRGLDGIAMRCSIGIRTESSRWWMVVVATYHCRWDCTLGQCCEKTVSRRRNRCLEESTSCQRLSESLRELAMCGGRS